MCLSDFRKNTYMFSRIHVRVFGNSRTCFPKNMYDFFGKHVRVFPKDDGDIQAIIILYNKPNNQLFFKV